MKGIQHASLPARTMAEQKRGRDRQRGKGDRKKEGGEQRKGKHTLITRQTTQNMVEDQKYVCFNFIYAQKSNT